MGNTMVEEVMPIENVGSRNDRQNPRKSNEPYVVDWVPFKFTRLIDANGTYHKSVSVWDAKKSAETLGLQLVCFNAPEGRELALCKIIDYGKWKYQTEKQQKKQKQQQQHHEVKELKFSPHIGEHDIEHKVRSAKRFLAEGDTVILTLFVTGRDLGHMDLAQEKMNEILQHLKGDGKIISRKTEGGQITVKMVKS